MLHINLLPPYIYEGKKKKQLIAFWSLAAAATVGGFIFWLTGLNATLAEETAKKDEAVRLQGEHDSLVTKINGVKTRIAEIQQKQDFIAGAQVYNDSWREGLLLVRDVVNPRIVLRAVNFDQSRSSVNMNAFAPSELDAIRWWMVLLNQTDKFTNVNITLPPHGYQPGGATTGAAPGGMMGGSMGGGGARAATMASMSPSSSAPGSMGSGLMMGGRMGGPMGGSMGGMGGGTNAGGSEGVLDGRNGFDFVCTAGLVTPLKGGAVAPAWSGVGAGGAGAPGGMMGGGSMGGMMGGGSMGGMMGGSMGGGSRGAGMAP